MITDRSTPYANELPAKLPIWQVASFRKFVGALQKLSIWQMAWLCPQTCPQTKVVGMPINCSPYKRESVTGHQIIRTLIQQHHASHLARRLA